MHTTFYAQNLLNVMNSTEVIACKDQRGSEVPQEQSTPEVLKITLSKQMMQVSTSVITMAESPLSSSKVPDMQPSTCSLETYPLTDPNPSIMGMLIIHLSWKSQTPPWLKVVKL